MRNLTTRMPALAVPAVLLGLAAACADDGIVGQDGAPTADVDGEWSLLEGTGPGGEVPIVDDHRPSLLVDGDDWSGHVCNRYSTTATVDGTDVALAGVVATEMACMNGGIMESEDAYLDAFVRVDELELIADRLVLRGDEVELVYDPVEPEPEAPLTGTVWRLESLVEGDDPDAAVSQATTEEELVLDDDGTLRASTGCRDLAGPYHLDGRLLDLTEVDADDAECGDPALVRQDEHVTATLLSGTAIRLDIDGPRLELRAPTGPALHYRATETP